MAVAATDVAETALLVLEEPPFLFSVSSRAFQWGQGSRKQIRKLYRNALVIYRSGLARRIVEVRVLGPWGESPGRRILSVMTSAWELSVQFSDPIDLSLEDFKRVLLERLPEEANDLFLAGQSDVVRAEVLDQLRKSESISEVFDSLRLPEPEDALDVL